MASRRCTSQSLRCLFLTAAACLVALTGAPGPVAADPPPWAPAHGWRKKRDNDREEVVVVQRVRKSCGGLDNQAVGSTAGAAGGALLGNMAGGSGSDGRLAGSVAGAAGGALLGGLIGRSADRDRAC
jgi:hypothetical protein